MTTILPTLLGSDTGTEAILTKIVASLLARHSLDYVSATTTHAAATTDHIVLCDATGGAFDVDLYAVSGNGGRVIEIVKIDASGNAVTVDGNAAETINNAATQSLASRYSSIRLFCTGTEWVILSKNL